MFPGFPQSPEPSDEERQQLQKVMEKVEEVGRKCGLYLENAQVMMEPHTPEDHGGRAVVVAHLAVGDLAFHPRVLNPESEDTNKIVRMMEVDHNLDKFNETRRKLTEGEGPLADLAGDDADD